MSTIELRKGREFGEIISDTFGYVRTHFKSLGKGLLLYSLPMIILSGILIGSGFGDIFALSEAGETDNIPVGEILSMFGGFILMMLTFVVIIQITFKHINLIDKGVPTDDITMGMLTQDFARNFFGLIGLGIVIAMATFVGFLVLFFPGIYVHYKLSLAPALYIINEEEFMDSLSKSWELTKDYWWFTFGVNLVMSIIVNIISNIAIIPFYIVMVVVVFSSGEPNMELFGIMFSIFYALIMIVAGLLYCFPIISQAMVFFSLDESKSGNSLKQRIDALANQNFQD